MPGLLRFGVSIEESLLDEFDGLIKKKGYANRSDAIRTLIRASLLETKAEERPDLEVIGTITLVYDHALADLPGRLTELQHHHHGSIVSTLHVHFDARNCLEVLVVRGGQRHVRSLSDSLIGMRGVRQGKLVITAGAEGAGHAHAGHSHHAGGRRPRRSS